MQFHPIYSHAKEAHGGNHNYVSFADWKEQQTQILIVFAAFISVLDIGQISKPRQSPLLFPLKFSDIPSSKAVPLETVPKSAIIKKNKKWKSKEIWMPCNTKSPGSSCEQPPLVLCDSFFKDVPLPLHHCEAFAITILETGN